MTVTKEEFAEFKKDLKQDLDERFRNLNKMLQPIVDPINGIYIQLSKNKDAAEKAHNRLDEFKNVAQSNQNLLKGNNGNAGLLDDVRDLKKFKALIIKLIWIMITPAIGAIGYTLYEFFKSH